MFSYWRDSRTQRVSTTPPPALDVIATARRRYLGDGVLFGEDLEEEPRGGLSLAVRDGTVAVHHQVLLDPGGQVLLPAQLQRKQKRVSTAPGNPNAPQLLRSGSDPAAIVHADQRLDRLRDGVLGAQAHGAGYSRAGRRLRVAELEAGGHDEAFGVVGVSLHQQVCVPLAVDEKMLGPVLVQAERLRHLRTNQSRVSMQPAE